MLTEITTCELFVPESVTQLPALHPIVEPEAVVLPAVLAPSRLIQLFSAAAPGAATEILMPLDAIVPEALVPAKAAVAATKLLPALDAIAVVKNAGMFRLNPEELTVHATPFAVRAVFSPIASLLALAVVR